MWTTKNVNVNRGDSVGCMNNSKETKTFGGLLKDPTTGKLYGTTGYIGDAGECSHPSLHDLEEEAKYLADLLRRAENKGKSREDVDLGIAELEAHQSIMKFATIRIGNKEMHWSLLELDEGRAGKNAYAYTRIGKRFNPESFHLAPGVRVDTMGANMLQTSEGKINGVMSRIRMDDGDWAQWWGIAGFHGQFAWDGHEGAWVLLCGHPCGVLVGGDNVLSYAQSFESVLQDIRCKSGLPLVIDD